MHRVQLYAERLEMIAQSPALLFCFSPLTMRHLGVKPMTASSLHPTGCVFFKHECQGFKLRTSCLYSKQSAPMNHPLNFVVCFLKVSSSLLRLELRHVAAGVLISHHHCHCHFICILSSCSVHTIWEQHWPVHESVCSSLLHLVSTEQPMSGSEQQPQVDSRTL